MAASVLAGAGLLLAPGAPLPAAGRMDRLCAVAVCAAELALGRSPSAPGAAKDGPSPERVAVVVGTAHGSHATDEAYYQGLVAAGGRLEGASPRLFIYTLPSSPAGEICIRLGLRGPALAEVSGATAGLAAVGEALGLLDDGHADLAVVCAVDVTSEGGAPGSDLLKDGAAVLVLSPTGHGHAGKERGQVGPVVTAFRPGDPVAALHLVLAALPPADALCCDRTTAAALQQAGPHPPVTLVDEDACACGGAVASVYALVQATEHPAARALVLCCDRHGHAAGALWVRPGTTP